MSNFPTTLLPDSADLRNDGELELGGCSALELAQRFGTPVFIYDEEHIRSRCRQAVDAFGPRAAYAAKAFLCRALVGIVEEEGMQLDVATEGELRTALLAGFPAERLIFHGNNKSMAELRLALSSGVGRLVIDSLDEIARAERLVRDGLPVPSVFLRITPGIEVHTHEKVRTGQEDSKFGFGLSNGAANEALLAARASPHLDLRGLHVHIGSQIFATGSYETTIGIIAPFVKKQGLPELSIGGGLGVAYVEGEKAPSILEWSDAIRRACEQNEIRAEVWAEPGRAIVASAAVTLYTIGTIKRIPGIRTYVAVDGGMSDNPRPALYGSGYEAFLPRAMNAERSRAVRIVGKHCESGDVLVREVGLPDDVVVGDIVATPVTGAYGYGMSSNYNRVPRPAVVFVRDGRAQLVVRRESIADVLQLDV